jgi:glycosyltransferase GT-like protein
MILLDEFETLEAAHAGRSIARFGDGELKIATGRDAKSQPHDKMLELRLREALKSPGTTGPLVCIPRANPKSPKVDLWRTFETRQYLKLYDDEGTYGSPFITRPDSAPWIETPKYWERVVDLWRDRDVVLVRGPNKSLRPEDMTAAASIEDVLCPAQNAWTIHGELFERLHGERRRVIFCLGATATVLAFRLGIEGVHAIDLGHIGMFMRRDPFALSKMRPAL